MTATTEELLQPTHALLLLLEFGARERFAARTLGRGSLGEMRKASDALDTCPVDDPAITGATLHVITLAELDALEKTGRLPESARCQ